MNVAQLNDMLRPAVEALGYELWGCEYLPQGRHSVLRVYVDSEQGVTLDACQQVSRQVSAILDVEEPITGHYDLEVSSPGVERPLFTKEHFERFVGHTIKVVMHMAIAERRKFVGELRRVEQDNIIILFAEEEVTLPFADIKKAKLVMTEVL